MDGQSTLNTSCVKEGDWVVLASSDGKRVLGHVIPESTARVGRVKRNIYCLKGAAWGTLFAARGDGLHPCAERNNDLKESVGEVDNRSLQDDHTNQRLSEREIRRLKDAGASGDALVNAVVANSATFAGKTRFSQEKYMKRKRDKFDIRVRVLQPTALTLCETYFLRSPEKILHIRSDSLALLLGYGGVVPHRHVLVADNCIGLLTGAVAERLFGYGRILNLFEGITPPGAEVIRMLNLPEAARESIVHIPFDVVRNVHLTEENDNEAIRYTTRDESEASTVEHPTSAKRLEAIARRPKRGLIKQWLKDGFDCLVVAVRFDVVELFDMLINYLAPSGTFAAYCTHFQEAAQLQYALQLSKLAIRIELTESMLTHHQILPGRSHPEMTDSATGGYIVSGIRIELPPRTILNRNLNESPAIDR